MRYQGREHDEATTIGRQALAEGAGWLGAGLANAPFVALLSSASLLGERLLHHLLDLGHFTLLGALAAALRAGALGAAGALGLRRGVRALLAVALLSAVAAWALREDLAGFLERNQVPAWAPVSAALAVAFAVLYLGLSYGLERAGARLPWWAGAVLVVALVAAGNLILPADYPGLHFFVVACAARVGAASVLESPVARRLSRPLRMRVFAGVAAVAMLTLALRPSTSVWRRVFNVPGSVAPELLGALLAPFRHDQAAWIPPESVPWFRDRHGLPPRPGYPKAIVPKDAIVVLLTIDALRADVVFSKQHDQELPELARLRDQSLRFVNARSPSPSTLTTAVALFTSKYYSQTYWTKSGNVVLPTEDDSVRWPSLLSKRGIRTSHVVGLRGLSQKTGVGRGFDRERLTKRDYGRARDVMNLVLEEVKSLGDGPGFIYAHFVDSHAPYDLAGKEGSDFERYLGEVALVDRELGRLRKLLARGDLRKRAVLFVSADHGEAFGEHGLRFHARSVYEELLHVPLLVALPEARPRDVAVRVSLVDLGPTLLDLFGVAVPGDFMGESLVPLLAGDPLKPTRPLAADSGRRLQALLFPDGVKAIRDLTHQTSEVYDLVHDPGELRNLMDSSSFPAQRYAAALDRFFEIHTLTRPGWEPPWRKF